MTERKAFAGENADEVRQAILEATPAPPRHINPKANLALSEVIMKALSKEPQHRYGSAQELIVDLEKCKENPEKAANAAKTAQAAKNKPSQPAATNIERAPDTVQPETVAPRQIPRVAAAAAANAGSAMSSTSVINQFATGAPEELPTMSATVAEPEVKTPRIMVDPLMDETRKEVEKQSHSFSEISELPPLKEIYIAPPPPPAPVQQPDTVDPIHAAVFRTSAPEKPKVQPKEVAKKAVAEITKTPPKLFGYAIAAAIAVILLVVAGIAYHIHSENSDDDAGPAQSASKSSTAQSASQSGAAATEPATAAQTAETAEPAPPITTDDPSAVAVQPKYKSVKKKSKAAPTPAAAAVVPGQLTVNTTPQGAQVSVDGQNDPGWITPYNMSGLAPGQHTVVVSKAGYAPETRNVDVTSGSKFFLVVQLAQLTATISVASTPAGAAVLMDGKDTGRVTPMQLSVDKPGNHTFLFKKQGFLDETTTANLATGSDYPFDAHSKSSWYYRRHKNRW